MLSTLKWEREEKDVRTSKPQIKKELSNLEISAFRNLFSQIKYDYTNYELKKKKYHVSILRRELREVLLNR